MGARKRKNELSRPVSIQERKFDLRGWEIELCQREWRKSYATVKREHRKTLATVTYLGLQALNLVLVWMNIIPPFYGIAANIYFTWRLTALM